MIKPKFENYDSGIEKVLPFYKEYIQQVFDLVLHINPNPHKWLDTGCGTGNLICTLQRSFPTTSFFLADPDSAMLEKTKDKLKGQQSISFFGNSSTQQLSFSDNSFDVITAIQCHHYLQPGERIQAVKNCYRMLKPHGIYITFENTDTYTKEGHKIAFDRWKDFQINSGRAKADVKNHLSRYNSVYFPITPSQHLSVLSDCGFATAEIFWYSYCQIGLYAIK